MAGGHGKPPGRQQRVKGRCLTATSARPCCFLLGPGSPPLLRLFLRPFLLQFCGFFAPSKDPTRVKAGEGASEGQEEAFVWQPWGRLNACEVEDGRGESAFQARQQQTAPPAARTHTHKDPSETSKQLLFHHKAHQEPPEEGAGSPAAAHGLSYTISERGTPSP